MNLNFQTTLIAEVTLSIICLFFFLFFCFDPNDCLKLKHKTVADNRRLSLQPNPSFYFIFLCSLFVFKILNTM